MNRITGESIAEGIIKVLENHQFDIRNCRGQAYDTTASMSSSRTGVQAYVRKNAPDAEDYQGCCLHSLKKLFANLLISLLSETCLIVASKLFYFLEIPRRDNAF